MSRSRRPPPRLTAPSQDIKSWFQRSGAGDISGADPAELQGFEKQYCELPDGLYQLYSECDGGALWFYEKQAIPFQGVAKVMSEDSCPTGCVPFASDIDGEMLLVASADGVYELDVESGDKEKLAGSFKAYLEAFEKDILSNKFEFIEDLGVTENMGGSRPAEEGKSGGK